MFQHSSAPRPVLASDGLLTCHYPVIMSCNKVIVTCLKIRHLHTYKCPGPESYCWVRKILTNNGEIIFNSLVKKICWFYTHDDFMVWTCFLHCWPNVMWIHDMPVDFPLKGPGMWSFDVLFVSLISSSTKCWIAGDLKCSWDVTVISVCEIWHVTEIKIVRQNLQMISILHLTNEGKTWDVTVSSNSNHVLPLSLLWCMQYHIIFHDV